MAAKVRGPPEVVVIVNGRLFSETLIEVTFGDGTSTLINFYAKCGYPTYACRVLDEMPEQNVVSWTALIQGFVARGMAWWLEHELEYSNKSKMGEISRIGRSVLLLQQLMMITPCLSCTFLHWMSCCFSWVTMF